MIAIGLLLVASSGVEVLLEAMVGIRALGIEPKGISASSGEMGFVSHDDHKMTQGST